MPAFNDPDYLKTQQYRDAGNLNARAALHERFTTNRRGLFRWIFDHLLDALGPDARILEVGCGPAQLWRRNLNHLPTGWSVTLTDFSPGMVAAARERLAGHEAQFTFAEADVQALPFADGAFDAVIASYMLYHVPDRPRAFAEIVRVLRPGGKLFATTNGSNNLRELKDLIAAYRPGSEVPLAESWFHMGNGAEQLAPFFADVTLLPYEDSLIVTEAQPVVDYVLSLPAEYRPSDAGMAALADDVADRIARDGAWHVQKETGMFVARKAGRDAAPFPGRRILMPTGRYDRTAHHEETSVTGPTPTGSSTSTPTPPAPSATVGVIGGSGLYQMEGFENVEEVVLATPFGAPSDAITLGTLEGVRVAFLPRHGRGHRLTPTEVPSRANIYAMKSLGVSAIISVSAVGSLREDYAPLDLVIPDQLFDRTKLRPGSFFEGGLVAHVSFAEPFCPALSGLLYDAAAGLGDVKVHPRGTYVCIEGPLFSTRAESRIYRQWGCDIIGMTALPEAKLAREAEIHYATIAAVTDYDVWHESEQPVTVEMVVANLGCNVANAKRILRAVVPRIAASGATFACGCESALAHAIQTERAAITAPVRERYALLAGKYFA